MEEGPSRALSGRIEIKVNSANLHKEVALIWSHAFIQVQFGSLNRKTKKAKVYGKSFTWNEIVTMDYCPTSPQIFRIELWVGNLVGKSQVGVLNVVVRELVEISEEKPWKFLGKDGKEQAVVTLSCRFQAGAMTMQNASTASQFVTSCPSQAGIEVPNDRNEEDDDGTEGGDCQRTDDACETITKKNCGDQGSPCGEDTAPQGMEIPSAEVLEDPVEASEVPEGEATTPAATQELHHKKGEAQGRDPSALQEEEHPLASPATTPCKPHTQEAVVEEVGPLGLGLAALAMAAAPMFRECSLPPRPPRPSPSRSQVEGAVGRPPSRGPQDWSPESASSSSQVSGGKPSPGTPREAQFGVLQEVLSASFSNSGPRPGSFTQQAFQRAGMAPHSGSSFTAPISHRSPTDASPVPSPANLSVAQGCIPPMLSSVYSTYAISPQSRVLPSAPRSSDRQYSCPLPSLGPAERALPSTARSSSCGLSTPPIVSAAARPACSPGSHPSKGVPAPSAPPLPEFALPLSQQASVSPIVGLGHDRQKPEFSKILV
eukprot:jgi/Botrbrau1/8977/Bobra.0148s0084.1